MDRTEKKLLFMVLNYLLEMAPSSTGSDLHEHFGWLYKATRCMMIDGELPEKTKQELDAVTLKKWLKFYTVSGKQKAIVATSGH